MQCMARHGWATVCGVRTTPCAMPARSRHLATLLQRWLCRRACTDSAHLHVAMPQPADDVFETRLFGPYQDALPPPRHVHPGHLVVNKPDLGPEHWVAAGVAECRCGGTSSAVACGRHGGGRGDAERPCRWTESVLGRLLAAPAVAEVCVAGKRTAPLSLRLGARLHSLGLTLLAPPPRLCAKEAALRGYDGPTFFAVPGNHDWIDGLDCFQVGTGLVRTTESRGAGVPARGLRVLPSGPPPHYINPIVPSLPQKHIQHKGWIGGWLMPQVGCRVGRPGVQAR